MITVAALYVDPRGPYPKLEGVECWDEKRDARAYYGPHPVVAHPPCGAYSKVRHLNLRAPGDCGVRAVEQVQRFGGVLEQPAGSLLWKRCGLPSPNIEPGLDFSIEVTQVSWGHVARKLTWLYCVGVPLEAVTATLRMGGTPTHWCSGRTKPRSRANRKGGGAVPPGIKVCSAEQRRRTPVQFAEWLVALARTSTVPWLRPMPAIAGPA